MSKKEQLRQQLLEKTLGKNAKRRTLDNVESELRNILKMQQTTIEELSKNTLDEDLNRINEEMKKDFGVVIEKRERKITKSLDDVQKEIIQTCYYKEIAEEIFNFFKVSHILERKESSCLIYNYKEIEEELKKIVEGLYEGGYVSTNLYHKVDFKEYANKNEIFYQDLYEGLYGDASLLVLDHIEKLPLSFASSLLTLLKEKEMPLLSRYSEVQGTLKETGTQLVKDAISSLLWKDKHILLLCHESLDDFSDKYGMPFVRSIDEVIQFIPLKQEYKQSILKEKIDTFTLKLEKHFNIPIKLDILSYFKNIEMEECEKCLESLFVSLLEIENLNSIEIYEKDGNLYLMKEKEEINLSKKEESSFEEIDEELQKLVGLKEVKEYLSSLKNYYATLAKRKAQGKKVADVSKHMIFTGNPGTGKTTVARILSKYLKESAILESGHLIEVTRKDLVGQYVGHTAQLTNQVIASALGGVLFIDEAYSLYRGQNDSYGLEAIDTLVKCMEDYRDNLVVILAGYKKEMEEFLSSNSGLRSRFANTIEFKDYTGEELYEIAKINAKGKDYQIEESAKDALIQYFEKKNKEEGGNGRLVRNAVEKAMIAHALRNSENDILILEDFIKKGSDSIEEKCGD